LRPELWLSFLVITSFSGLLRPCGGGSSRTEVAETGKVPEAAPSSVPIPSPPGEGGASSHPGGGDSPDPDTGLAGAPTGGGASALGDGGPTPSYAQDIAPLFELRCVKCHGSPFQRNDLRLTTYAMVMRGGETGPAIVAGDPDGSLLVKKIEGRDKPTMPPRKPLTKDERELVRRWVASGALP
jgi:hypothetical protein